MLKRSFENRGVHFDLRSSLQSGNKTSRTRSLKPPNRSLEQAPPPRDFVFELAERRRSRPWFARRWPDVLPSK